MIIIIFKTKYLLELSLLEVKEINALQIIIERGWLCLTDK